MGHGDFDFWWEMYHTVKLYNLLLFSLLHEICVWVMYAEAISGNRWEVFHFSWDAGSATGGPWLLLMSVFSSCQLFVSVWSRAFEESRVPSAGPWLDCSLAASGCFSVSIRRQSVLPPRMETFWEQNHLVKWQTHSFPTGLDNNTVTGPTQTTQAGRQSQKDDWDHGSWAERVLWSPSCVWLWFLLLWQFLWHSWDNWAPVSEVAWLPLRCWSTVLPHQGDAGLVGAPAPSVHPFPCSKFSYHGQSQALL